MAEAKSRAPAATPAGNGDVSVPEASPTGNGAPAPPLPLPTTPDVPRPSLRMLADRPLGDDDNDRLGFTAYADALAELIDNPDTDTPLTIAISAPWGAGKTSLARILERRLVQWPRLRGDPPHVVCWFNAWIHDDAPHLGAAFAADVAKAASRFRPWWWRLASPLPGAMLGAQERWRRRVLLGLAALAVSSVLAAWAPGVRDLFTDNDLAPKLDHAFGARFGSLVLLVVVIYAVWTRLFAFGRAAASFVDDPRSEAARGSMHDVTAQLGSLVRQATRGRRELRVFGRVVRSGRRGRRRLVIFVDDLERCRPPRAVEVCEVASQLLGHPDVVAVLVADMAVIAASAQIKYAALEQSRDEHPGRDPTEYGRFYLQKMVQIQFDLPPARVDAMRSLLRDDEQPAQRTTVPAAVVASARAGPTWRPHILGELQAVVAGVLGVTVTLFIGVFFFWPGLRPQSSSTTSSAADIPAIVSVVVGFIAALTSAGRAVASQYARRTRRKIDEEIREMADRAPSADGLTAEVLRSDAVKGQHATLVRQRVQRYLTDESVLRKEAESEILKFLPPLPRSAKRMLNHLRVLLTIAVGREMLGGRPALTPSHLGKWVVLNERWPELARDLSASPQKLRELEKVTRVEELGTSLQTLELETQPSSDLFRFLRVRPRLGGVLDRLVFLEPAGGSR